VNAKQSGTIRVPLNLLGNTQELQEFIEKQNLKGLEKGVRKLIIPKGRNLINLISK